jgi:CRP/FNR family transcriptional regulator, cyclic AMP receptor protein
MTQSPIWYFERFGLLRGLSAAQRQRLERHTQMTHHRRGETIGVPRDASARVHVVKTGAVKVIGRSPDGHEVILGMLGPGDLFGALLPLGDASPQHAVQAAVDCVVCTMPQASLLELMQDSPAFALQVTKLIGLKLHRLSNRVEELLGRSASARLAHTLLDLAERHGVRDDDGVLISLRLSQGDLGKLVGLARETVNGILQAWRDQGIVVADRRSIRVRDPERLTRTGALRRSHA